MYSGSIPIHLALPEADGEFKTPDGTWRVRRMKRGGRFAVFVMGQNAARRRFVFPDEARRSQLLFLILNTIELLKDKIVAI